MACSSSTKKSKNIDFMKKWDTTLAKQLNNCDKGACKTSFLQLTESNNNLNTFMNNNLTPTKRNEYLALMIDHAKKQSNYDMCLKSTNCG